MTSTTLARCRRHHQGFNMVEVLVTLAVLSVGLLGLAALQSIGVRFNHQSYQRTQAVLQAYDLVDRMRTNKRCRNGLGCTVYDTVNHTSGLPSSPPNCISASGGSTCTESEMATYDISQWNIANGRLLSLGAGAVCRGILNADRTNYACTPAAAGIDVYSIAIFWVENDLNMRVDVQTEL